MERSRWLHGLRLVFGGELQLDSAGSTKLGIELASRQH